MAIPEPTLALWEKLMHQAWDGLIEECARMSRVVEKLRDAQITGIGCTKIESPFIYGDEDVKSGPPELD